MGVFVYLPLCHIRVHSVQLLETVLAMPSLTTWLNDDAGLLPWKLQAESVFF